MSSIVLFLSTCFIAYLIDTIFVSLAFALYLVQNNRNCSGLFRLFVLFLLFSFLDLYPLPAALSLDAVFTINNLELANLLGVKQNMRLDEFISYGLFDVAIWFIQAGVANGLGNWFSRRVIRA